MGPEHFLSFGKPFGICGADGRDDCAGVDHEQYDRAGGQLDRRALVKSLDQETMLPMPAELLDITRAVLGRHARGGDGPRRA